MKKALLLIIILLLAVSLTGCKKGKKALKTLTCEYDFSDTTTSSGKTNLKIVFNQDSKTYALVKGTVTFDVSFTNGLSNEQMNELKASLNEQFCTEGFFGEGTNKSCKVTSQTKSANVTIELDTDKLVDTMDEIEKSETMLDDFKGYVEEIFGDEVKCSIN